uniref:Zinc finger family protein n=1 Tax=Rhizophora mucronata TaxID=61149 RepID=A0A2P2P570_RHIMU
MQGKVRVCELCNQEATLYCGSDAAFLCFDCDSNVHNANFIVARHIRRLICPHCMSPTENALSSTRSPSRRRLTCHFCSSVDASGEEPDTISCSSSSSSTLSLAGMSSTQSQPPVRKTGSCGSASDVTGGNKNIPARFTGQLKKPMNKRSGTPPLPLTKTENIFENWCKKLWLNSNLVLSAATHAAGLCSGRLGRIWPLRVILAASFWFGLRLCGVKSLSTWQNLRRLEEISGVPAKVIAAVELKLEHASRAGRLQRDMKEGWAES